MVRAWAIVPVLGNTRKSAREVPKLGPMTSWLGADFELDFEDEDEGAGFDLAEEEDLEGALEEATEDEALGADEAVALEMGAGFRGSSSTGGAEGIAPSSVAGLLLEANMREKNPGFLVLGRGVVPSFGAEEEAEAVLGGASNNSAGGGADEAMLEEEGAEEAEEEGKWSRCSIGGAEAEAASSGEMERGGADTEEAFWASLSIAARTLAVILAAKIFFGKTSIHKRNADGQYGKVSFIL